MPPIGEPIVTEMSDYGELQMRGLWGIGWNSFGTKMENARILIEADLKCGKNDDPSQNVSGGTISKEPNLPRNPYARSDNGDLQSEQIYLPVPAKSCNSFSLPRVQVVNTN